MRRAGAAGVLAVALVLTSCASPRNALNTPAGTCFRGLPAARAAVGPEAQLIGVRRVSRKDLVRAVPQAGTIRAESLCLVTFHGPFSAGQVPQADPAAPGAYAMVALDIRGSHVLGAFVLDDLPLAFRHRI